MSGCATTSPVEMAAQLPPALASPDQTEVNSCRQWLQAKEDKEAAQFDKLQSHDMAYALMHRDTMKMVTNVFGKEQNACKPGTNVWDAYIAWAKEEGATKRQYSSDASSVAKFGIVTTGAVKLADSIMGAAGEKIGGDKVGGDKVTVGRDSNKTKGDIVQEGNTNKADTTKTNLSQTQTGVGSGSPSIQPATINKEKVTPTDVPAETPGATPAENPVVSEPTV